MRNAYSIRDEHETELLAIYAAAHAASGCHAYLKEPEHDASTKSQGRVCRLDSRSERAPD
jgi:hypothetical protein